MSDQMQTLHGITLLGRSEKMRYFPSFYIKYALHDPPIDVDIAKSYHLEPQVIELLQALPYVVNCRNDDEFVLGGGFADMRDPEVLKQSRDPAFYCLSEAFDEENGECVRPWELCINERGNHGTIISLDTRNGHLTITRFGDCEDPGLEGFPSYSEGLNRNSHAHLPSRHAKEVFEDFTNRLMRLQWIPNSEHRRIILEWDEEYEDLNLLFRTYGWPHTFNPTGFDSAYTRWREYLNVKQSAFNSASNIITDSYFLTYMYESLTHSIRRQLEALSDRNRSKDSHEYLHLKGNIIKQSPSFELYGQATIDLERTIARHGDWNGERWEMIKAWKKHFEDAIELQEKKLKWRSREGKQFSTQKQIGENEENIKGLKERLANVEGQPMTAEEAIEPL